MIDEKPRGTKRTLLEAQAALTTDAERNLFVGCCLALGALRAVGTPGARQTSRMIAQCMGAADPWAGEDAVDVLGVRGKP